MIIAGAGCVHILAQHIFRAIFVDEQGFIPGELDRGEHEVNALGITDDALGKVHWLFCDGLVDNVGNGVLQFVRVMTANAHGDVCLRVKVYTNHLFALPNEYGGEVHHNGGLCLAALLMHDCDYLGHRDTPYGVVMLSWFRALYTHSPAQ